MALIEIIIALFVIVCFFRLTGSASKLVLNALFPDFDEDKVMDTIVNIALVCGIIAVIFPIDWLPSNIQSEVNHLDYLDTYGLGRWFLNGAIRFFVVSYIVGMFFGISLFCLSGLLAIIIAVIIVGFLGVLLFDGLEWLWNH